MLKMLCADVGISEFFKYSFTPCSFKTVVSCSFAPHGNILLSPLFRKGGLGCGLGVACSKGSNLGEGEL